MLFSPCCSAQPLICLSNTVAYKCRQHYQDNAPSAATIVLCVTLITTLDIGHDRPLDREAGRVVSNTVLKTVAAGQAKGETASNADQ